MNLSPSTIAILMVTPFFALMTYAIYHFGYFIYHWHKVVSNVTNKYSMFIGPFLLLRPSNFNEIGQESLLKSMYHFRRFFFSLLPMIPFAIIGIIAKTNPH